MSKGLEAYKIVKEECDYTFGQTANGDRVRKNLPIIEKELLEYEYWSKFVKCFGDVKPEDLQRFIHNGWVYEQSGYKREKAFEIIRDRNVAIGLLKITVTLKTYNEEIRKMLHGYDDGELTQEQYDLLKEVIL